jgi:hypothetical protein
MEVYSIAPEERVIHVEFAGVRPDVALGDFGGFLHDFAQLSGEREALAVFQQRGFDVENVAAGFCPG